MGRKNKASPGKDREYMSEAQRRDMEHNAARQSVADAAAAGTSTAAAANVVTTDENVISRPASVEELQRLLAAQTDSIKDTLTAQLALRDAQIQLQNAKIAELEVLVKRLMEAPPAAARAPADDAFVKPGQLQALVPEALVQQVHHTIRTTMEQERRGMLVTFDTVPRPPKPPPGAQGGVAGVSDGNRQRPPLRLVDLHMAPGSRRALASLGRVLRERHGILIRDALTRAGVEARQRRGAVFAALRNEASKPGAKVRNVRWENGIEVTFLTERNVRAKLDFTKPIQGQLPDELAAQLGPILAAASMAQGVNAA